MECEMRIYYLYSGWSRERRERVGGITDAKGEKGENADWENETSGMIIKVILIMIMERIFLRL